MSQRDQEILDAVERERKRLGAVDPALVRARSARLGSPVPVLAPDGSVAFYLVPLVVDHRACGFARVEPSLRVSQLGIFGGHADDESAWIDEDYFARPPARLLDEVLAAYPGSMLSAPVFSYDRTPARWGWRVEVVRGGAPVEVVFIGPTSWYRAAPVPHGGGDREG